MRPLLDQSHLDASWHAGQYQALPHVYVQNSALEIAWTRVVTRDRDARGQRARTVPHAGARGVQRRRRGGLGARRAAGRERRGDATRDRARAVRQRRLSTAPGPVCAAHVIGDVRERPLGRVAAPHDTRGEDDHRGDEREHDDAERALQPGPVGRSGRDADRDEHGARHEERRHEPRVDRVDDRPHRGGGHGDAVDGDCDREHPHGETRAGVRSGSRGTRARRRREPRRARRAGGRVAARSGARGSRAPFGSCQRTSSTPKREPDRRPKTLPPTWRFRAHQSVGTATSARANAVVRAGRRASSREPSHAAAATAGTTNRPECRVSRSVQVRTAAAPARAERRAASPRPWSTTTTSSTPRIAQKSGSDQASAPSRRVAYEARDGDRRDQARVCATALPNARAAPRRGRGRGSRARSRRAQRPCASIPRATRGAIAAENPGAKSTIGPAQSANVRSCASRSAPVR